VNEHTPNSDNPQEEWRRVPGLEHVFIVSNLGRVRMAPEYHKRRAGQIAKQHMVTLGYLCVSYSPAKKKVKLVAVHRLVMLAFVGPCPDGKEVHHIDKCKANNRLDNLMYVTHIENLAASIEDHQEKQLRGEAVPTAKLTEDDVRAIRALAKQGQYTQRELAQRFGVSQVNINHIINRRRWEHIE
jgi:predicted XRE-type DNA-binding protein